MHQALARVLEAVVGKPPCIRGGDEIILRLMSLCLIASRIRQGGRLWTAALCTMFALTAARVPCLYACMGHATATEHARSPSGHPPAS